MIVILDQHCAETVVYKIKYKEMKYPFYPMPLSTIISEDQNKYLGPYYLAEHNPDLLKLVKTNLECYLLS